MHLTFNQGVLGSSPSGGTILNGSIEQLVARLIVAQVLKRLGGSNPSAPTIKLPRSVAVTTSGFGPEDLGSSPSGVTNNMSYE